MNWWGLFISPVYLKRGGPESATSRLKDNTVSAVSWIPPEHMSSTVSELYKFGDIFLSMFSDGPQNSTCLFLHSVAYCQDPVGKKNH